MTEKLSHVETRETLLSSDRLLGRRDFVALAGLSAAMVGLQGCIRRPEEKILPYTTAPEYTVPGVPLHYATVLNHGGDAVGVLVESHEGRPTKIEGNPEHPASKGATDAALQAELMNLYDADRSRHVLSKRSAAGSTGGASKSNWAAYETFLKKELARLANVQGEGLRILSHPSSSVTWQKAHDALMAKYPNAKFVYYHPSDEQQMWEGSRLAFGRPLQPHYDYERARVILSIDADFIHSEASSITAMRSFMEGRRVYSEFDRMSRLYVVESTTTLTGANADHRLCLPPNDVERYLRALALELVQTHGVELGEVTQALGVVASDGIAAPWIKAVAKDLASVRSQSIIVVGCRQPARVHALAHALNAALGNEGRTVKYTQPSTPIVENGKNDLASLVDEMKQGKVKTLFILGANPVYDAPGDLKFVHALGGVETSIHLGSHVDETAEHCSWHLPMAHALESWGDARSRLGTWAIQQPLIAPLFYGRSAIEVLGAVAGVSDWRGYAQVRQAFRETWSDALTPWEQAWRQSLHAGIVSNTPWPVQPSSLDGVQQLAAVLREPHQAEPPSASSLQVVFTADPRMAGGCNANNPWLLELPDPITQMCWDNAALISANTAKALHVKNQDVVRLRHAQSGQSVEVAIWIQPGMADFLVALPLGWGRKKAGRYGSGCGFDGFAIRQSQSLHVASGFKIELAGRSYEFARTQEHTNMEGRPLAISDTLARYHAQPDFPQYASVEPTVGPLWQEKAYTGHKWGMSIDLNACTGCSACVIACQSENNIATVGKEEVRKGREMQWIRIDRYFSESEAEVDSVFQPVACQHCEEAPCENVCPVNATTHSPEGLNDMTYNRCIGTRYCANNCPYKVRRFNYLNYQGDQGFAKEPAELKKMQFNPDVTVRMRGVMEKCTYCVQRIQEAKIKSRVTDVPIKDGDVVPACAQACPTHAIAFGDLNDKRSQVAKLAKQKRGYHLLAEVGTQPRTRYLARLRNVNPEMRS